MALSMHDFAILLLSKLAENSLAVNLYYPKQKYAILPFNYRERIENILCADNGWKEEFSSLIDVADYFDDHFWWEERLAHELQNAVQELKKNMTFDIVHEEMSVIFYPNEIQKIFQKYDKDAVKKMGHFVNLLLDSIYTRKYREQFFDYSARSVSKMRTLMQKTGKQ